MTMNAIDDLLRLVRENEEYRAAMQRELLTDALLALPEMFAAYSEVTDSRLRTIETTWQPSRHHEQAASGLRELSRRIRRGGGPRNDRLIAATIARARGNRVRLTERLAMTSWDAYSERRSSATFCRESQRIPRTAFRTRTWRCASMRGIGNRPSSTSWRRRRTRDSSTITSAAATTQPQRGVSAVLMHTG